MSTDSRVNSAYHDPNSYDERESHYGDGIYPPDWDQRRKKVLRRDDWVCQSCGEKSGPHADGQGVILQVHHKNPLSEGGTNALRNLETLCIDCHNEQHDHDITRASSSKQSDEPWAGWATIRLIIALGGFVIYVYSIDLLRGVVPGDFLLIAALSFALCSGVIAHRFWKETIISHFWLPLAAYTGYPILSVLAPPSFTLTALLSWAFEAGVVFFPLLVAVGRGGYKLRSWLSGK